MSTKPLIYDFGMHNADDTEIYLRKGFRVVAIEADPSLCEQARKRLSEHVASGELVVVNKAIGERPGTFSFYVCNENDALSTAALNFAEMRSRHSGMTFRELAVEFTTADQIIAEHGLAHYIKIDIEGHDLICLKQMAGGHVASDFLSFELDRREYPAALGACRQMGFTRFALVDQGKLAGKSAPNPSREGLTILHRYEIGQAGPFGADVESEWMGAEEITARCRRLSLTYLASGFTRRAANLIGVGNLAASVQTRFMPAAQTWYDIHAAR